MATLEDIQAATLKLSETRAQLSKLVDRLNTAHRKLLEDQLPAVRSAINEATDAWTALEGLIESNPGLFQKPRTRRFHDILVGYQKGRGGLVIAKPERTVELIKRHFPDQAEVLIDTKETPAKGALQQLPVADLKRLAVDVKDTGDVVVIRPADTDLDKLVKSLVDGAIDEAQQATS